MSRLRSGSWTWTSVDGSIDYDDSASESWEDLVPKCGLQKVEVLTEGANPFGPVISGSLQLCGSLHLLNAAAARLLEEDQHFGNISYDFWDPGSEFHGHDHEHYRLDLVSSYLAIMTWGLLLRDRGNGEYERCGVYQINDCEASRFSDFVHGPGNVTNL